MSMYLKEVCVKCKQEILVSVPKELAAEYATKELLLELYDLGEQDQVRENAEKWGSIFIDGSMETVFQCTCGKEYDLNQLLLDASGIVQVDKTQEAIESITAKIKEHPDQPFYYYCRGCRKDDLGDLEGAVKDWDKTIELADEDFFILALTYYNRGLNRSKLGDIDGALSDYINASKRVDGEKELAASIHCGLGGIYFLSGQAELAKVEIMKTLEIDPHFKMQKELRNLVEVSSVNSSIVTN